MYGTPRKKLSVVFQVQNMPIVEQPANFNVFNSLYCPVGCCRSDLVRSLLLWCVPEPLAPDVVLEVKGCQNDEEEKWAERWYTRVREVIDDEAVVRRLARGE